MQHGTCPGSFLSFLSVTELRKITSFSTYSPPPAFTPPSPKLFFSFVREFRMVMVC